MPRTINEGFEDFEAKLTPIATESEATQSHRASIEACLKGNFELKYFFRTGSIGNGTSISGYSDVDYFASIPRTKLKQDSGSTLRKVRDALDTRFPTTGVRVNCPAVLVPFGTKKSEDTEVVPADYIDQTSDGYNMYEIPDCSGGWMVSSPKAHNAYVTDINKNLSFKVKPLIRFIKAWKYFMNVPISSFYLEIQTAKYASDEKSIVYSIDIKRVLKKLYDEQLAMLRDPLGISGYIKPCYSDVQKDDALSKLETAYTRAEKAVAAESAGKIDEAFDWWRKFFGEKFPTYYYT